MESILILTVMLLLVLLVFVSWRARAQAMNQARRLAAEGARGREIESIAMDAASLLGATQQSVETALITCEGAPRETQRALEDAARAAGALTTLFHAARVYFSAQDHGVARGAAEGCVRVAIAVARSRGCGISVRGERTDLAFQGRASEACAFVVTALEACRATLSSGEYVEVVFDDDAVQLIPGTAGVASVDLGEAARLAWSVERSDVDGRSAITIRARPEGEGEPRGSFAARAVPGVSLGEV